MSKMSKDFVLPLDGGCRCGALRYRVTETPLFSMACHFTDCQQLTSSAFSLGPVVPEPGFTLTGEPHVWEKRGDSGGWSRQHTCPDCAGWTHTLAENGSTTVIVRPSTLDDSSWFRPIGQVFSRSAWPSAAPPGYDPPCSSA